jgi:hypothetical protein
LYPAVFVDLAGFATDLIGIESGLLSEQLRLALEDSGR